jgi:hypothetical protein
MNPATSVAKHAQSKHAASMSKTQAPLRGFPCSDINMLLHHMRLGLEVRVRVRVRADTLRAQCVASNDYHKDLQCATIAHVCAPNASAAIVSEAAEGGFAIRRR